MKLPVPEIVLVIVMEIYVSQNKLMYVVCVMEQVFLKGRVTALAISQIVPVNVQRFILKKQVSG